MVGPNAEPLVVRTLREYREALDAREMDAMRTMAASWVEIERKLEADMAALALEMDRRMQAGEAVTEQIVWRQERYQALKAKLGVEVKRWNGEAFIPQVEVQQRQAGWLGIDAAKDAIIASYGPLSAPFFPILNREAVEVMVGLLGNGAPLNTLLKNDYPEALDGLVKALVNGVARGLGPGQVAKEMADGLGMGLERAMLIARTEINRTYRTANVMQYRESNVVSGFRRLVKKATACLACLMLDGQTFDKESELDDHPRGKCVAVPVVMGLRQQPQWTYGEQYFLGLGADAQRERMGAERYELWKEGAFELADLAQVSHNAVWGDKPRVATLAELTK